MELSDYDRYILSRCIDVQEIIDNPYFKWDKECISLNDTVTLEVVDTDLPNATGEWGIDELSESLAMEEIRANMNRGWSFYDMSWNPGIMIDDVLYMNDPNHEWHWAGVTSNIDIVDIKANPHLPWRRSGLSLNENVTLDMMKELESRESDTSYINNNTLTRYVPLDDIMKDIYSPYWTVYGLSQRRDMTLDILGDIEPFWNILSEHVDIRYIRDNPHLPWCRYGISSNTEVTLDDVLSLDLSSATDEWNWYRLSTNIDIKVIRDNPEQPWSKTGILENKGITLDDIYRR